jgi:hypothetical protein
MSDNTTLTNLFKRSFVEMMKDVATSIPGRVIAFDTVTQRAQVQIGIVRKDVNGVEFTPSPLIEVPVYFAGGSQFHIEHQIDPLDEGIILFSQRCIDAWVNSGGVALNPIMRFHSQNDAMFLPGLRSNPNVITLFDNNGVKIRNQVGDHHVWLKNDGTIEFTNTNATMLITAGGAFNGTFTDFNVDSRTFTHNGTNVGDTHKHESGAYNVGGNPVVDTSGAPE